MSLQILPWTIPSNDLASLKDALRSVASQRKVTRQQRVLIQRICSEAEKALVAPETFFVVFKHAVQSALQELHAGVGRDRDELTARVMTVCIEEFYQGDCGADLPPHKARIALPLTHPHVVRSSLKRDDECRGIR